MRVKDVKPDVVPWQPYHAVEIEARGIKQAASVHFRHFGYEKIEWALLEFEIGRAVNDFDFGATIRKGCRVPNDCRARIRSRVAQRIMMWKPAPYDLVWHRQSS